MCALLKLFTITPPKKFTKKHMRFQDECDVCITTKLLALMKKNTLLIKTHKIPRWLHHVQCCNTQVCVKKEITQEMKLKQSLLIDDICRTISKCQHHALNYKVWLNFSKCLQCFCNLNSLLEFLVFQIGNFGRKTKFG
jgi:hypothetical protein